MLASSSFTAAASSGLSKNASLVNKFPFFTFDDYEIFGQQTIHLSGALLVGYTPLVRETLRNDWEEYSVKEQGWIHHGIELINTTNSTFKYNGYNRTNFEAITANGNQESISPFIFRTLPSDSVTSREFSIQPEKTGLGIYSPYVLLSVDIVPCGLSFFLTINLFFSVYIVKQIFTLWLYK